MKNKKILFVVGIFILVLGIIIVIALSKKETKEKVEEEEQEWVTISSKYNYVPRILNVTIPEDFGESEIIDIYIVSETLDKQLIEKTFLSGVYSWKWTNDGLGILIPEILGIRESLTILPEALGYTLTISKSSKKVGELEINQELLKELLKNIEYIEPDESDPIYTTD